VATFGTDLEPGNATGEADGTPLMDIGRDAKSQVRFLDNAYEVAGSVLSGATSEA
jgi:hypothetical protein